MTISKEHSGKKRVSSGSDRAAAITIPYAQAERDISSMVRTDRISSTQANHMDGQGKKVQARNIRTADIAAGRKANSSTGDKMTKVHQDTENEREVSTEGAAENASTTISPAFQSNGTMTSGVVNNS